MHVLIWRGWVPPYDPPALFSALPLQAMGGADVQLLWHASSLVALGHHVEVLGVSSKDVVEEGVHFVGAEDRAGQEASLASRRITSPDVIFCEKDTSGLAPLARRFPQACLVHVMHSMKVQGVPDRHFSPAQSRRMDAVVFVGAWQYASYSARFPELRHKYSHLPAIAPWETVLQHAAPETPENLILWIGQLEKYGLRHWAMPMERILREYPAYR